MKPLPKVRPTFRRIFVRMLSEYGRRLKGYREDVEVVELNGRSHHPRSPTNFQVRLERLRHSSAGRHRLPRSNSYQHIFMFTSGHPQDMPGLLQERRNDQVSNVKSMDMEFTRMFKTTRSSTKSNQHGLALWQPA